MFLRRKLVAYLENWKLKAARKPLIIRGARQVGKTTMVKEFGKGYSNFINLDLEKKEFCAIFDNIDRMEAIVDAIFLQTNTPRTKQIRRSGSVGTTYFANRRSHSSG